MIHLAGPALLASVLAGLGVYGMLARRNAVLVLIGAELLLNAANVLLVTASTLPTGGLAALHPAASAGVQLVPAAETADPLLPGQVLAIFVITIAAAEIGVGLAIVLLLFRARGTVELTAVQELGEASPTYTENPTGYPGSIDGPVPVAGPNPNVAGGGPACRRPRPCSAWCCPPWPPCSA